MTGHAPSTDELGLGGYGVNYAYSDGSVDWSEEFTSTWAVQEGGIFPNQPGWRRRWMVFPDTIYDLAYYHPDYDR